MQKAVRLSSDYALGLFELLEEHDVSPIDVCCEAGVVLPIRDGGDFLLQPGLIRLLNEKYHLPQAGLLLGMRMGTSRHGFLGYAAKSSATIAAALEVDARYLNSRMEGVGFRVRRGSNGCQIEIDTAEDPVMERFIVELIIASLASFFFEIFPGQRLQGRAQVRYLKPDYYPLYSRLTDLSFQFGAAANRVEIPDAILQMQLPTADEALLKLSLSQCEQATATADEKPTTAQQVRAIVGQNIADPASLPQVAHLLKLHERTLKRRLAAENTSYRAILAEARLSRAKRQLAESDIRIDDLAYQLGYSSPASFKRLFKGWCGETPGAYRRRARSERSRQ